MSKLANLKHDLPASVVVFFVALPLCLGIALASGAPLFSGLIAGVVGGVVVGSISQSRLGVSGPAAGLAVIVEKAYVGIALHFLDVLGATPEALMQIALGALRAAAPSHAQVVDLLYTNVIGTPPTAEVRAALTAVLDSGSYTVSGMDMAVAEKGGSACLNTTQG